MILYFYFIGGIKRWISGHSGTFGPAAAKGQISLRRSVWPAKPSGGRRGRKGEGVERTDGFQNPERKDWSQRFQKLNENNLEIQGFFHNSPILFEINSNPRCIGWSEVLPASKQNFVALSEIFTFLGFLDWFSDNHQRPREKFFVQFVQKPITRIIFLL